jgi:hypothetical protein
MASLMVARGEQEMRIGRTFAVGAAVALTVGITPAAQAGFVATIEQVGANVVVDGGGTINLAGLTSDGAADDLSGMEPSFGVLSIGTPSADSVDQYTGFVGPSGRTDNPQQ